MSLTKNIEKYEGRDQYSFVYEVCLTISLLIMILIVLFL